jgi:tetratricopeptide (TPR) repeat protein
VWQVLFDSLKDRNFVVLAVAMDNPEAAKPWIEAARPGYARPAYPCLIDRDHHVADLYNLVNVPQAVWIDEAGHIVRPPECAGSTDAFRAMNRVTVTMPEEAIAERNRIKALYLDAIRDWVLKGERSIHVLSNERAAAKLKRPDPSIALAHVRFRLGQHLLRTGQILEAEKQFAEAIRLHPESWNIWRQTAPKLENGFAAGPEFWARVDALGERSYHAPIDLVGVR